MPSTAGPGTIAMIISSASSVKANTLGFEPWVLAVAPVAIFLTVAVILWGCLLSSGAIMRLVGKSGIEAISRLMGFLLVCMGVQFIINGVLEIISTYTPAALKIKNGRVVAPVAVISPSAPARPKCPCLPALR
jgi:Multiple antibiotic transporter